MEQDTLVGHLLELSRALDDYREATCKAETHLARQIEKLWEENARLRDDMHLAIRGLTLAPEAVAAAIHSKRPDLFICNPDEAAGADDE